MDDNARIYEDVSWLPSEPHRERGSGRSRTVIGTAAVMAVAATVGFGGAMVLHNAQSTSPVASTTTMPVVTTSGGS